MRSIRKFRQRQSRLEPAQVNVRQISAEETYPIRQVVLRPGKSLEDVFFPGDSEASSIHLGAFLNGELLGVASFMRNRNSNWEHSPQFQLRGMAVLPEARTSGLGKELLLTGEDLLKQSYHAALLWFNARESAIPFYKKHGYMSQGDLFEIPDVCTHILMYKIF